MTHQGALLLQEDLILLRKDESGVLRFVSGAVLFPQRWSLAEKIGNTLDVIHEPVPLYANSIARPLDKFMERLADGKLFCRSNWTVCLCAPHLLSQTHPCRLT